MLGDLLYKGINPDLESDAGKSLVWAAGDAQQAVVTVLLKHGANVILPYITVFMIKLLCPSID